MWLILVSILVILLAYTFISRNVVGGLEGWVNYETPYFGYKRTGTDPLINYVKPLYRKPYRYPFMYHKSYPYNHLTYYPAST